VNILYFDILPSQSRAASAARAYMVPVAPFVVSKSRPFTLRCEICPRAHNAYVALRPGGIVAKLRKALSIAIPIGYQDETGFHRGVKAAEKEVKWCRFGNSIESQAPGETRT
jgi:hypothetical protein